MQEKEKDKNMRILTGLQPTGPLHIGNYFGAVRQMVDLQDEGKMYFFIADLHALTDLSDVVSGYRSEERAESSRQLLCASIALGINPKKTIVYRQSDFPQITELAWIFSCLLKHNFLTIGHAYKDALQGGQEPGVGVFLYPVLMATDILIADAEVVPTGKDQTQHLEITREIARKFNHLVQKDYFQEPQVRVEEATGVIPGIDGEKMSKSRGNTLPIFEEEEALRKRIMRIVTDSTQKGEPINTETCLLCTYLARILPREEYGTIANRCANGTISYAELKKLLADQYLAYFSNAREMYDKIIRDETYTEKILSRNRKKIDARYTDRLREVKKLLGIL